MSNDFALMLDWLQQGEEMVVLTLISRQGSAPRLPGSRMILTASGRQTGTIGGGSVEARALHLAREVLQDQVNRILHCSLDACLAAEAGMVCGGSVDILLERLPGDDYHIGLLNRIKEYQDQARSFYLLTPLPQSGHAVEPKFCLEADGRLIGSSALQHQEELMDAVTNIKNTQVIDLEGKSFLVEPCWPGETLYLFGAGHIGREICPLAAHLGFQVVVLDDRAEFLNRECFPAAHQIRVMESFRDGFQELVIDTNSMILIVTRGHLHDKTVLAQALQTEAFYIGMIGSIHKRDSIYEDLLARGVCTFADLERVNCPVGFKINAETPAEIAISIAAQLIQARAMKRRGTIK